MNLFPDLLWKKAAIKKEVPFVDNLNRMFVFLFL